MTHSAPDARFGGRLAVPLIAAPMYRVSGPELVVEVCRAGAIGAFPTSNCASLGELDEWLGRIHAETASGDAPPCANLIIRQARLDGDLELLLRHRVEMVITSVGSPAAVVAPLQGVGCRVFADVASLAHAERALAAGVDGLVLLTAGAGGQTGWANPFAFVRAVRRFYDGPLVLAGGVGDGRALWAARVLGVDLGYMGTRFIATKESLAKPAYKQMLVQASLDDIVTTRAFTGLPSNMLRPSIEAAGLDPDALDEIVTAEDSRTVYGADAPGPRRWADIWSAGHSVSLVDDVPSAAEIVRRTALEYDAARRETAGLLGRSPNEGLVRDWG